MHPDPEIYRALLEDLFDGVLVINFDGSVMITNDAFCRMFELDQNEVAGRSFGEIFITHKDFDEFTQIIFDAITDQGRIERHLTNVYIGDDLHTLSVTTSYLTTGREGRTEKIAVIVVVADITEIRELREAELRMAKVIEKQLDELQSAYRDIEARNAALSLMMKRVHAARSVAIVFVLGLFLTIGVWRFQPLDLFSATAISDSGFGAEPDVETPQTMIVEPGEFHSTISLRGNLTPGHIAEVVSPIESHVSAVHTNHGQQVMKGTPLVALDTEQIAAQYRRARIEHIKAHDRLVEIDNWENSAGMARARRALRRAKIGLDDAKRDLDRAAFLLEEGLIPASEQEEAWQTYENRQLDYETAKRELESEQEKGNDEARQVAQLEEQNARGRMREHEKKLKLADIRAPIPGIIVIPEESGAKPLVRGRPVASGELLLSIADFERISVITSVDEIDVRKIQAGQQAWVTGPGFPGLRIEGVVTRVSPRASGSALQRNTPQFQVVITLSPDTVARERLRVGMSAHVTIVTRSHSAALLVPLDAVEQFDGMAWVRVIDRNTGNVEKRAVILGLTTLDSVEVMEGISSGDEIVLFRR